MLIRPLTREDMLEARRIRAISFLYALDEDAARAEIASMSEEDIRRDWGCFDEAGHLMACITNNDMRVYFDGHIVRMGGIGNVATLPEYRQGGAIKAIFAQLLRAAREEGEVFSSLYPFLHEFYRKVGYETFLPVAKYEFPISLLSGYRFSGAVRRMEVGESVAPMKEIYAAYAARYNFMLLRGDRRFSIGDPFRTQRYTMLLGGNRAYLTYRCLREHGRNILSVEDMAYRDVDGLHAILGYLARMSADFALVRIALPSDVPLYSMVPRPYELACSMDYALMARVTNAEEALALMDRPEDADFTIEVADDFLPDNSGVYRVNCEGVRKVDADADLSVSIQAFAPLVLGTLPLQQALYRRDVQLRSNYDALARVFRAKPVYLTDHF